MKTMDYQLYSEYLEDNPNIVERGFWNDLTEAVEVADHIGEVPAKFGMSQNTSTEIIRIVSNRPSKWSSTHSIDGYVVVAYEK